VAETRSAAALVVYALNQHPIRSTLSDHLYSFRRHGSGRYHYLNLAARAAPDWLRRIRFDAVIFHNSFLGQRWTPELFEDAVARARPLKELGGTRIALPQDEFLRADLLSEFIEEFGVDSVLSVSPESEWPKIYPGVDRDRVRFGRVLTGYLEESTIARIDRIVAAAGGRPIDVGYRSMPGAFWLGSHGMLKRWVAEQVERAARTRGMRTDVSTEVSDVLFGDDWFRFLAASKCIPGVEGGASLLDRDGALKDCTERYLIEHPGAPFEDVERHCFPGRDGELALFAASPRHLEACATRTCQLLVEGEYSGVLEAGRHYLALRRDLSNLDEVLDLAQREDVRDAITEAAYSDVVGSGRYTYAAFVAKVEEAIPGWPIEKPARSPAAALAVRRSGLADRASWLRVIYRLRVSPGIARWRGRAAASAPVRLAGGALRRARRLARRPSAPPRDAGGAATVVSLTPIALERDSRTLKQAASLQRFGYRSIVVEGEASGRLRDLPFELVTIEGALPAASGRVTADDGTSGEAGDGVGRAEELETESSGSQGLARLRHSFGVFRWRLRAPLVRLGWFVDWNRRAYRALPDADLYIVHSFPLAAAVLRRCLGRRGRQFSYDAHDAYFQMRPAQLERLSLAERIWAGIERVTVRRAAAFTTVGEGVADLLEERHKRRPRVIRNCHDRRLDRPGEDSVRSLTGASRGEFLLVAVGNDKDGMTLPAAIRAIGRLPERFRLVYLGRGHERHRALVDGLGLSRRVHHLPAVAATGVVPLIGDADAALVPYRALTRNYAHALPNGFFQAIGAGLPLIYPSSLVDVAAIAQRYEIGVAVDTADPESIADALRSLGEDPERTARYRANAASAREQESWEREETLLAGLVEDVLDARRPALAATLFRRSRAGGAHLGAAQRTSISRKDRRR
jgi:glycosyltransferase involved in cell wall biosynthesis